MSEKLSGAEKFVEARVRVRYAETDQMGVVYHANYLVWFEVGRVEMIRQMGISYKDMEREELLQFLFDAVAGEIEKAERLKRNLFILKADREIELDLAFARIDKAGNSIGGVCIGPVRSAYARPGRLVTLAARHPRPLRL